MMLEKNVEARLVRGIKARGGIPYKFTSPNRRSVPDRLCVMPGNVFIFVEVKTDKGRLTSGQSREIARLRDLGCAVEVVYGPDQVDEFLAGYDFWLEAQ